MKHKLLCAVFMISFFIQAHDYNTCLDRLQVNGRVGESLTRKDFEKLASCESMKYCIQHPGSLACLLYFMTLLHVHSTHYSLNISNNSYLQQQKNLALNSLKESIESIRKKI